MEQMRSSTAPGLPPFRGRDITGLRSGRLVALCPTTQKRRGVTLWRCACDCGGEILLEAHKISRGTIKSCGCLRVPHYKDLTGQTFGKLTALEKVTIPSSMAAPSQEAVWNCRCTCGNTCTVSRSRLESGAVTSCGCDKPPLPDLTGQRFGNLLARQRVTPKSYLCRCDCGTEKTLPAAGLLAGRYTSCGCMQGKRRQQDLTGLRSGKLTVIERTDHKRRGNVLWRCRCDCGNELLAEGYRLSGGQVQSCGCSRRKEVRNLTAKANAESNA